MRLRVVLDTNLLISYLLTQGKTISRIIDFWESGQVDVLLSPPILEELIEVVKRPRLRQYMTIDPHFFIDLVASEAIHVNGKLTLPGISRDPKDDKFLACAVEGEADYLVTGDEDLLILEHIGEIPIVRPFHFIQIVEAMHIDEEE